MGNNIKEKKCNKVHCIIIIFSAVCMLILTLVVPKSLIRCGVLNVLGIFAHQESLKIFVCALEKEKEFIGTVIWTMTTILFGFLIMYYQMLGGRNFGLTNRMIISYTCGSYFIPLMVAINTVVVCFMTVAFYFEADTNFYLLASYSFVLQGMIIFYCVYPTSHRKAKKTILQQEKEHFCNFYMNLSPESTTQEEETPTLFMESILYSDELIVDKLEMISEILRHPFKLMYFDRSRIAATVFEYYYLNFSALAVYLADHPGDTNQFYKMLYQEIAYWMECFTCHSGFGKFMDKIKQKKNHRKRSMVIGRIQKEFLTPYQNYERRKWDEFQEHQEKSLIKSADDFLDEIYFIKIFSCLGALFQAFLAQDGLKNCWLAITHIVNHLVPEKIHPWILSELFLCIEFLFLTDQIDLSEEKGMLALEEGVIRLERCQGIEKNIRTILDKKKVFKSISCYPDLIFPWIGNMADSRKNRFEILYKLRNSFEPGQKDICIDYLFKRMERYK